MRTDPEKLAAAYAAIDTQLETHLALWRRLCIQRSPTGDKAGVDAVGRMLADWAACRGFAAVRFPMEKSGDCWRITLRPDAPGKPVALSGHMDTVLAPEDFGPEPVHTAGDWLCGPGAADDKGGLVLALLTMAALDDAGFDRRPVHLLLQSDEETGSVQSGRKTIETICREVASCAAFFNLEPARQGTVTVCRKGIFHLRLDVRGVGVHAAWCHRGASAVAEAARIILELEKLKDQGGVTCTCGMVQGGTAVNSVPETCSVWVDLRYLTQEQQDWARRRVDTIVHTDARPGCTTAVTELSRRVPMPDTAQNRRLLAHMNDIFTACGLEPVVGEMRYGGSDASDVSAAGVPTVDGLGVAASDTHSVRERAYIPSLRTGARQLAAILLNFDERALTEIR